MNTTNEIERVSVTRLRRETADLLARVCYGGARIVITSSGKERAALVSVGDLERLLTMEQDATERANVAIALHCKDTKSKVSRPNVPDTATVGGDDLERLLALERGEADASN